jgi:hypothetical protein
MDRPARRRPAALDRPVSPFPCFGPASAGNRCIACTPLRVLNHERSRQPAKCSRMAVVRTTRPTDSPRAARAASVPCGAALSPGHTPPPWAGPATQPEGPGQGGIATQPPLTRRPVCSGPRTAARGHTGTPLARGTPALPGLPNPGPGPDVPCLSALAARRTGRARRWPPALQTRSSYFSPVIGVGATCQPESGPSCIRHAVGLIPVTVYIQVPPTRTRTRTATASTAFFKQAADSALTA